MAGTTVRDDGIVLEAFAGALRAVKLDGEEYDRALAYAHDTMGFSKTVVFRELLKEEGLVQQALAAFDRAVLNAVHDGTVAELPGARLALEALRASGITIAFTTGFSPEVQQAVIKQLGWQELADLAVAPGPSLRGRPFPDMVLYAALEAKVDDVREVAVVGDTANDLWSGHRAGAGVVAGVLTGSHDREELARAPHTHILRSITDLVPVLLS